MSDADMIPEPILFVFGPARGGTTFVNNLLAEWFGYTMGPEGTFVASLHRKLMTYGDLNDDSKLDRLLRDIAAADMFEIMRSKWPERARVDITAASMRRHLREASYAGAVHAALSALREARGRTRLGIKSPDYWMELDQLESIFGTQARYLFVVRDGRDVALSNFEISWGQRNAYAIAKRWVRMLEAVETFTTRVDGDRLLTLRYEDILREPEPAIATLERFLAAPMATDRRAQLLAAMAENPRRDNFGKWKEKMSADELRAFESVAAQRLASHGYEVVDPASRVSTLEAARFSVEETVRKVVATVRQDILGRR
jgi:hypothetical protein